MARPRNVVVLVIALTIAGALFLPLANAVTDNSGTVPVTNETVSAELDAYVDLSGYQIVSGSETVYGHNDTSGNYETVGSADYVIDHEGGRIQINSSSTIVQDGETIKVSYDYTAADDQTTQVLNLAPLLFALLMLGVMASYMMDSM